MPSVYNRSGKWYLRYKDGSGKWQGKLSHARTKAEAKRLAAELEIHCDRQRLGLEVLPPADGGGTFRELLLWWLETYSAGSPSHHRNESSLDANLLNSELAGLRLADITPGSIESYLQRRADRLGPQSLNHLRRFILTAFSQAKRAGRWSGGNPAKEVARRRVPKRLPDFLRIEEVPRVLSALSESHRPLFATAIYTGMRRGELLGLRKADVDLAAGLIRVTRSHGRDLPKGGKVAAVPIAEELAPILRAAMDESPSELVFPKPSGARQRPDVKLQDVLRRALARAGIVTGYEHVCRRKGCGHSELAKDGEMRRCPHDKRLLWPKAKVRPIRFHDLRHTTASLLMMAGVNPAAVQRILRHSDPRITMDVYGHLAPGYLKQEIDRLRFQVEVEREPEERLDELRAAANAEAFATPLLQASAPDPDGPSNAVPTPEAFQMLTLARHAGVEPATFGFGVSTARLAGAIKHLQGAENVRVGTAGRVQPSRRFAPISSPFVTRVLQVPRPLRAVPPLEGRFLTVREVARDFRVSTATVYAMCREGRLEHLRVGNCIRIPQGALRRPHR